jgi:hypothetical protein
MRRQSHCSLPIGLVIEAGRIHQVFLTLERDPGGKVLREDGDLRFGFGARPRRRGDRMSRLPNDCYGSKSGFLTLGPARLDRSLPVYPRHRTT